MFQWFQLAILFYLFLGVSASAGQWGGPFLCEWMVNPDNVSSESPIFAWEFKDQAGYRLLVSDSYENLKKDIGNIWDSGVISNSFNLAEYTGNLLSDKHTYFWKVKVLDKNGTEHNYSPVQQFTTFFRSLPRRKGHIRTFLNFGQHDSFIASHFDLTFRDKPKMLRPAILALNYSLLPTMELPSEKAEMLAKFSQARGLTESGILEEFFLHFIEDQDISLHVGQERPEFPIQTRRVPGWDPANDKNGDGIVNDKEFADRKNIKASAREKRESRVPIYYWGPPNYDYVMNISHPLYLDFLAEIYVPRKLRGYDGVFFDTLTNNIPGPGRGAAILELQDDAAWGKSIERVLARIKQSIGKAYIIGNGWYAEPFVIDGTQHEQWLNISRSIYDVEAAIQSAVNLDNRGKVQLLQYNPIQNSIQASEKMIWISKERDMLYGLALYYLVQGNYTYFGFADHPYDNPENNWFPAMEYNLGSPKHPFMVLNSADQSLPKENLLRNASFESEKRDGKIEGWIITEPVETVTATKNSGYMSIKITSTSLKHNNINSQYVYLEPYTVYTAGGYISTEKIEGPGGAQVYPYGSDDIEYIDKLDYFLRGSRPWTFCSFIFKTGASGIVRINFRIKDAKGAAWFDDIFLVKGSYPNWKVLSREYEKGLVLVKSGANGSGKEDIKPTMIGLDNEYQPLRWDGTLGQSVRQISLGNNEATILIRK